MYRLGHKSHRRHMVMGGVLLLVLCIGGGVMLLRSLHLTTASNSQIHNNGATTSRYDPSATAKVHIDQPLFRLNLPAGWKTLSISGSLPLPVAKYQSPSDEAQELSIYIDNIPTTIAVNRVVDVTASGAIMSYQPVSDNCASYTPPAATGDKAMVAAKWQGDNFICDLGNYERDVIGTASTDGINQVVLTGTTTHVHKLFMLYTDNNVHPDYNVLYGILSSFSLK